jgi:hypothetical protein
MKSSKIRSYQTCMVSTMTGTNLADEKPIAIMRASLVKKMPMKAQQGEIQELQRE